MPKHAWRVFEFDKGFVHDPIFQPQALALQNMLREIVTSTVDIVMEPSEVLFYAQPGRAAEKISQTECVG